MKIKPQSISRCLHGKTTLLLALIVGAYTRTEVIHFRDTGTIHDMAQLHYIVTGAHPLIRLNVVPYSGPISTDGSLPMLQINCEVLDSKIVHMVLPKSTV